MPTHLTIRTSFDTANHSTRQRSAYCTYPQFATLAAESEEAPRRQRGAAAAAATAGAASDSESDDEEKELALNDYDRKRKPRLPAPDAEIYMNTRMLSAELTCPICLDLLTNTMTTKECLHRFCQDCITTALLRGNKECPTCRKKLVSKRSLRSDPNFDELIRKLWPDRHKYDEMLAAAANDPIKPDGDDEEEAAVAAALSSRRGNHSSRPLKTEAKDEGIKGGEGRGEPSSSSSSAPNKSAAAAAAIDSRRPTSPMLEGDSAEKIAPAEFERRFAGAARGVVNGAATPPWLRLADDAPDPAKMDEHQKRQFDAINEALAELRAKELGVSGEDSSATTTDDNNSTGSSKGEGSAEESSSREATPGEGGHEAKSDERAQPSTGDAKESNGGGGGGPGCSTSSSQVVKQEEPTDENGQSSRKRKRLPEEEERERQTKRPAKEPRCSSASSGSQHEDDEETDDEEEAVEESDTDTDAAVNAGEDGAGLEDDLEELEMTEELVAICVESPSKLKGTAPASNSNGAAAPETAVSTQPPPRAISPPYPDVVETFPEIVAAIKFQNANPNEQMAPLELVDDDEEEFDDEDMIDVADIDDILHDIHLEVVEEKSSSVAESPLPRQESDNEDELFEGKTEEERARINRAFDELSDVYSLLREECESDLREINDMRLGSLAHIKRLLDDDGETFEMAEQTQWYTQIIGDTEHVYYEKSKQPVWKTKRKGLDDVLDDQMERLKRKISLRDVIADMSDTESSVSNTTDSESLLSSPLSSDISLSPTEGADDDEEEEAVKMKQKASSPEKRLLNKGEESVIGVASAGAAIVPKIESTVPAMPPPPSVKKEDAAATSPPTAPLSSPPPPVAQPPASSRSFPFDQPSSSSAAVARHPPAVQQHSRDRLHRWLADSPANPLTPDDDRLERKFQTDEEAGDSDDHGAAVAVSFDLNYDIETELRPSAALLARVGTPREICQTRFVRAHHNTSMEHLAEFLYQRWLEEVRARCAGAAVAPDVPRPEYFYAFNRQEVYCKCILLDESLVIAQAVTSKDDHVVIYFDTERVAASREKGLLSKIVGDPEKIGTSSGVVGGGGVGTTSSSSSTSTPY